MLFERCHSTAVRTKFNTSADAPSFHTSSLEINQVVAYFAYANRTVLGLGVNTEGEILGLSPAIRTTPTTGLTVSFQRATMIAAPALTPCYHSIRCLSRRDVLAHEDWRASASATADLAMLRSRSPSPPPARARTRRAMTAESISCAVVRASGEGEEEVSAESRRSAR